MSAPPSELRSTFPVPQRRLQFEKLKAALAAPLTWAAYLPAVGAFAFLDVGPVLFGALLAGTTAGLGWYWRRESAKLESSILEQLVRESNEAQDEHLLGQAMDFLARGFEPYATSLRSFVQLKRKIERGLHAQEHEAHALQVSQLEQQVDELVFGVSDQLQRLVNLRDRLEGGNVVLSESQKKTLQADARLIEESVEKAWLVLEDTWQGLGEMLHPSLSLEADDAGTARLDRAVDRLRDEQEVSRRVRERLEEDWNEVMEIE